MNEAAPIPVGEGAASRRRYPRYQVSIPFDVTVFRPGTAVRLSGRAQDIGEGGLRGMISGAARPGERVELTLLLPTCSDPVTMHAVVRHENKLQCGFEFLSLEHAHREILHGLSSRPELQGKIINGEEHTPSVAPLPRVGTVVCSSCGYEYPEDSYICVMCGTPQTTPVPVEEVVRERSGPSKFVQASVWATAMRASAGYYSRSKGSRGTILDSVVAVVFLITLSVGLWQWLNSPAESSSRPSIVQVQLENILLRPVPSPAAVGGRKRAQRARTSSRGSLLSSTGSAAQSLFEAMTQPIAGSAASARSNDPIGTPGSAVAETPRRSTRASLAATMNAGNATTSRRVAEQPAATPQKTLSMPAASPPPAPPASAPPAEAAMAQNAAPPPDDTPSATDLQNLLLEKVLPIYPSQARQSHLEGQVVLQAVIGRDGSIAELRPLQGAGVLADAAMDAVKHWRFRPYEVNGKAVEVETDIRVNFQLPHK